MTGPSKIVAFPDRSSVEEEAARWILRHDEGALSQDEKAAFDAWRGANAAHQDAYNALHQHWKGLDHLARPAVSGATTSWTQRLRWRPAAAALAASIVAAAVLGGTLLLHDRQPAADAKVYATAIGDLRELKLADGSVVTLNTASRIEVNYSASERSVRLLSGEAFFQVAHDADRPFRVYAGDGVTTAVGTAFSVRLEDHRVDVVVSSGKISFAEAKSAAQPVAFVSAGQSASFQDKLKFIETVPLEEVDRKLSWTEGRLVFRGAPLSEVVADISRYTDVYIEIADADLAKRPIGGIFEVGKVDLMLDALASGFGLEVEHIDDKHVRIRDRGT